MENLIDEELGELEKLLTEFPHLFDTFPNGVVDPCPKYHDSDVLYYFASWYLGACTGKTLHTETCMLESAQQ